jgi:RNA recognition motif-containing protein
VGKRIYVGNLSFSASEDDLRGLFSAHGEIESVKVVTDAQTGRARGFAFVEMATEEEAQRAIASLNGKIFKERTLVVSEARQEQTRDRGGSAGRGGRPGGGGRGGYGGGRGTGRSWR